MELRLVFHQNNSDSSIDGYVDSDCAGDLLDQKFTTGYVFKVFECATPHLTSWLSKKQKRVALSPPRPSTLHSVKLVISLRDSVKY